MVSMGGDEAEGSGFGVSDCQWWRTKGVPLLVRVFKVREVFLSELM